MRLRRGRGDKVRQQEPAPGRDDRLRRVREVEQRDRVPPDGPPGAEAVRRVDDPALDQGLRPGHLEQVVRLRRDLGHRRVPRRDRRRAGGPLRGQVPAVPRLPEGPGALRDRLRAGGRRAGEPDPRAGRADSGHLRLQDAQGLLRRGRGREEVRLQEHVRGRDLGESPKLQVQGDQGLRPPAEAERDLGPRG